MPYSNTRRWTTEDVRCLKKLAQTHPTEEIAAKLGRSFADTVLKAQELKIPLWLCRNNSEQVCRGWDPGPAGFEWQELRETSTFSYQSNYSGLPPTHRLGSRPGSGASSGHRRR